MEEGAAVDLEWRSEEIMRVARAARQGSAHASAARDVLHGAHADVGHAAAARAVEEFRAATDAHFRALIARLDALADGAHASATTWTHADDALAAVPPRSQHVAVVS